MDLASSKNKEQLWNTKLEVDIPLSSYSFFLLILIEWSD